MLLLFFLAPPDKISFFQRCQSSSWRHVHKLLCPIYKRLYPKLLPNTVRAILEILLRRSAKLLPDTEWQDFIALISHADDFRKQQEKNEDGLTTWQTIELMSQAAMLYSGTKEPLPFVQEITSKVSIKTISRILHPLPISLTFS